MTVSTIVRFLFPSMRRFLLSFVYDREQFWLCCPEAPGIELCRWQRAHCLTLQSWTAEGWIPLCRTVYPGFVLGVMTLPKYRSIVMGFIQRSLAKAKNVGPTAACADVQLAKQFPALFEFMTCVKHEDGSSRKVSTVTLYFDQGQFKAFLNDKDSLKSLCVVGPTLASIWIALEASITSDDPQWRDLSQPSAPKRPGAFQKKT